ncbi:hypothetical protein HY468_01680 [Candidatus Roizmanbacteria bacterium]|nr:hypothetical protein [Candidatus Roizmanbacteria bacterium]
MPHTEVRFRETRWADDKIWEHHSPHLTTDARYLKESLERDGSAWSRLFLMNLINGNGSDVLTDKYLFAAMVNRLGFYPVPSMYISGLIDEDCAFVANAYEYAFEKGGVFAKPRTGSNGRDTFLFKTKDELLSFLHRKRKTPYIIQENIPMSELRCGWYIDDSGIRWRFAYNKNKTALPGNGRDNLALLIVKDQTIPLWQKARTIFDHRKSLGMIPRKGEIYNASITGNWKEGGYMSPVDRDSEKTKQIDQIMQEATEELEDLINGSMGDFLPGYDATPEARIRNVCYDLGLVEEAGNGQTTDGAVSRSWIFPIEYQHLYSNAYFFLSGTAPINKRVLAWRTYDRMIWNENSKLTNR